METIHKTAWRSSFSGPHSPLKVGGIG